MPATILTVLRSGGEYTEEHVERLRLQCATYAPDTEFRCLRDDDIGHDWPGWWAKIAAFRIPGPVLYMDLDTTIVGDLDPLLEVACAKWFVALRDFNPQHRDMGSGLMSWGDDMSFLYRIFLQDPEGYMAENKTRRHWGDQGFIEPRTPARDYWQDLVPGAVVSFKKHCRDGAPPDARVICHHGKPRPWEV